MLGQKRSTAPHAKTTLAGLSVGSAYHLLARTPLMQRIRIRRSLREQAGRLGALAHERAADWEHFPRAAVRRRLVDALKAPPVGSSRRDTTFCSAGRFQ